MGLFKRKDRNEVPAAVLELPVLNAGANAELHRKLDMEIRYCPMCGYKVSNPMNDRCPRCFTVVPLSEHTNCGECTQQGNCTYSGER